MTRRISTYLSLISVAVFVTGCSLLPPEAYVAQAEVLRSNANGAFRLAESIEEDVADEAEYREVAADVAHWKSLTGPTTTTLEMFLADRAKTREQIAAYRANKMIRAEEANEIGVNLTNGTALVEKEARLAARARALTGGTTNAARPN
jgi:hypothetical protein